VRFCSAQIFVPNKNKFDVSNRISMVQEFRSGIYLKYYAKYIRARNVSRPNKAKLRFYCIPSLINKGCVSRAARPALRFRNKLMRWPSDTAAILSDSFEETFLMQLDALEMFLLKILTGQLRQLIKFQSTRSEFSVCAFITLASEKS